MKWNKFVSMAFYVLLMLLLGNAVQAQSQVSRKSSKKILKQEQQIEKEVSYKETAEANETAAAEKMGKRRGRTVEQGDRAKRNKEDHPGRGHAYGKYKAKGGKAHARGKYKNKDAKASMKTKEKAGKQRLEKREIGKAYSKTRKNKSSKAKAKRTSRRDIPVQEN